MTARTAAALSSAALVLVVSGCTSFYEIPIETPIQPKMDVTPFQRVFIAGFIAGGSEDVDANLETVRLLRSQLRSKSPLRVIEADVLPLVELAREQAAPDPGAVPSLPPEAPAGGGQTQRRRARRTDRGPVDRRRQTSGVGGGDRPPAAAGGERSQGAAAGSGNAARQRTRPRPAADPQHTVRIKDEKDLEPLEGIFANVDYWKKLGEEYQNPLIVTGTVLFTPHARSGFVQREQEYYDSFGRRRVVPGAHLHGAQGLHPAAEVHLHRRPHRHHDLLGIVPRRGALQPAAEHARPVVVLRADGPADPELPEHAQHAANQGLPHPAEVAASARGFTGCRQVQLHLPLCLVAGRLPETPEQRRDVVYAIINTGGHQVKVAPGATVTIDRVEREVGDELSFTDVLLIERDGGDIVTGTPVVTGARVVGVVEGEARGPKIRVFKKKRRKGMRRTKGHRSTFTLVRITEIQA